MRWGIYALGLLAALGLSQCARSARHQELTVKGSDTMVILGQRWAERYMAEHPGTIVQVTGGGSGTGIAALINGTTDVCMSSRPMRDAEHEKLREMYGQPAHETVVARDGLAVYVHERNGVSEITLAQLRDVYTGVVTDWKDLGGVPGHINVYGRENSSGTYEYFKEHVLKGADFAAEVQTLPGTAAVVNAVAKDPNGIGYGGAAYAKGVRDLAVKADDASPAMLPTQENVIGGVYPIARPLYFYLREAPKGAAAAFIEYALSDSGQAIVGEVGYFPAR
jgi:phosphate transport system substrate-binding protein